MQSMTGYGRGLICEDGREMTVEVKSVNHRFLDVSFRLARPIAFLDDVVRTGVAVEASEEDRDAVRELFMRALNLALDGLTAMRTREGNSLRGDMLTKLDAIDALREQIALRAPNVVEEYRAKLSQRLSALLSGEIDEARFATEVAIFADRAAIDEELVRLSSHSAQLRATTELDEPVGRKLDFLVQELNREVNTIGSKASDAQIAGCVVAAKGEIEKLREQVQNIE